MRNKIFHILTTDPGMNALGITAANTYSGDPDSPADNLYAIIRWGETQEGIQRASTKRRIITVWFHTRVGTYAQTIDPLLLRTRQLLESVTARQTDTGWINQIEWETDSGDLVDDASRTQVRNCSFSILGSGI